MSLGADLKLINHPIHVHPMMHSLLQLKKEVVQFTMNIHSIPITQKDYASIHIHILKGGT